MLVNMQGNPWNRIIHIIPITVQLIAIDAMTTKLAQSYDNDPVHVNSRSVIGSVITQGFNLYIYIYQA